MSCLLIDTAAVSASQHAEFEKLFTRHWLNVMPDYLLELPINLSGTHYTRSGLKEMARTVEEYGRMIKQKLDDATRSQEAAISKHLVTMTEIATVLRRLRDSMDVENTETEVYRACKKLKERNDLQKSLSTLLDPKEIAAFNGATSRVDQRLKNAIATARDSRAQLEATIDIVHQRIKDLKLAQSSSKGS